MQISDHPDDWSSTASQKSRLFCALYKILFVAAIQITRAIPPVQSGWQRREQVSPPPRRARPRRSRRSPAFSPSVDRGHLCRYIVGPRAPSSPARSSFALPSGLSAKFSEVPGIIGRVPRDRSRARRTRKSAGFFGSARPHLRPDPLGRLPVVVTCLSACCVMVAAQARMATWWLWTGFAVIQLVLVKGRTCLYSCFARRGNCAHLSKHLTGE